MPRSKALSREMSERYGQCKIPRCLLRLHLNWWMGRGYRGREHLIKTLSLYSFLIPYFNLPSDIHLFVRYRERRHQFNISWEGSFPTKVICMKGVLRCPSPFAIVTKKIRKQMNSLCFEVPESIQQPPGCVMRPLLRNQNRAILH